MSAFARVKAAWQRVRTARTVKTQEALNPALLDLGNLLGLPAGAQRISARENIRDLSPLMHERMQQVCFFLAVTTPFGKRIVRIIVDYVVGEGLRPIAEDPQVQEVLDRFWNDPVNRMDENVDAFTQELLIFGELCIPVAVNPVDGSVRLGYIDPQEISEIEFGRLETASGSEISMAVTVRLKAETGAGDGRPLEIVRTDEDPRSPTAGQLKGECFYFAINKAKSASRGISELFALADWIDVFDQMVFDFADRVRFLNAFVWHYVLKGADDTKVKEFKKELLKSPPKQGGVQVTNEQVEIEARTPDLKGADMTDASRVVKLYGLGGAGMPAWFFADPMDANRATAQEMQGPTGKMLTNRQNVVKRMIASILDFVLSQAVAHGELRKGADLSYKLQVPDLSVKDIGQAATAMQGIVTAMSVAEDRGWVRGETAARAVHVGLSQVGVEVDADEFDLAQQEKQERDAGAIDALNPQKQLEAALKNLPPATETRQ